MPVTIRYYGHCAFALTLDDGTTMLIDPFRNESPSYRWFRRPFPSLSPDLALITHPHFDHDHVGALARTSTIIRHPLSAAGPRFILSGVLDVHARGYGEAFGRRNLIFVIESGGIRICHWGDNRADIDQTKWDALGAIDVLMAPVDGSKHLLAFEEVDALIRRLAPKVVFPTHYFIEGLHDPECTLGGIEAWLATRPAWKSIPSDSVTLDPSSLPASTEVWVFDAYARR